MVRYSYICLLKIYSIKKLVAASQLKFMLLLTVNRILFLFNIFNINVLFFSFCLYFYHILILQLVIKETAD